MKLKNILWAFALLSIVSCSSDDGPETKPTPTPTPPPVVESNLQKHAEDDEIKVMSFNVRLNTTETNYRNEWFYRKEAVIEAIEDHKPSVIGFQEAKYTDQ